MGHIDKPTADMGPFKTERRRDSFYLSGERDYVWWRWREGVPSYERHPVSPDHVLDERVDKIEIAPGDEKPEGKGWVCDTVVRAHGIWVYRNKNGQGTAEITYADLPHVYAAIDQVDERLRRKGVIEHTHVEKIAMDFLRWWLEDQNLMPEPGEVDAVVAGWYAEYRDRFYVGADRE